MSNQHDESQPKHNSWPRQNISSSPNRSQHRQESRPHTHHQHHSKTYKMCKQSRHGEKAMRRVSTQHTHTHVEPRRPIRPRSTGWLGTFQCSLRQSTMPGHRHVCKVYERRRENGWVCVCVSSPTMNHSFTHVKMTRRPRAPLAFGNCAVFNATSSKLVFK